MKLRHYDHDGRARFVTFNTHQRIPFLTDHVFSEVILHSVFTTCHSRQLRLLAYVIMPEHIHLVAVPPISVKLGPVIGEMKFSSAMKIHELLVERQSRCCAG